ncbi:cell wall hydrolase [Roseomonas elaeocarpi]|uniref:Cell wall hydrolase n=1 Tax=Roseomonas elaeocarpi TaxID=907779 RepID=A0ABV6JQ63_9PROT
MTSFSNARGHDVAVLAATLYAEAGARPVRAIEALATLVMNRVQARLPHWGAGFSGVCRAPFQFPCWNPNHPSHAVLQDALPGGAVNQDPSMEICRRVATRAVAGVLSAPIGQATHVHADDAQPSWSLGRMPTAEIGGLLFYRLEEAARAVAPSVAPLRAVG